MFVLGETGKVVGPARAVDRTLARDVKQPLHGARAVSYTHLDVYKRQAEEVVALADKLDCDTIVIGTRGLGAISGYALGSVSRKVLHLTHLPVICVK